MDSITEQIFRDQKRETRAALDALEVERGRVKKLRAALRIMGEHYHRLAGEGKVCDGKEPCTACAALAETEGGA